MRRTWFWVSLGIAIGVMPLVAAGCASHLAGVIVTAPNAGLGLAQVEALPDVATGREPEYRFRVTVGPPTASLAVRVLDPAASPLLGVTAEPRSDSPGRYRFHLVYADPSQVVEVEGGPAGPQATVLVLHGLFGRKDTLPTMWARMLAGAGYRAVLVDMRGHGRSTGHYVSYGVRESRDLVQVIDDLERRGLLVGRLGVLGISFGGSTAIQLAAIDDRVEAVVALAPFNTMREAVSDFGRAVAGPLGPFLPEGMIQRAVTATESRTGVDPALSNAGAALGRTRAAVLLVHGQQDVHVPVAHSVALRRAMQGPGHLMVLAGETHMTLTATPGPSLVDVSEEAVSWFDHWLLDEDGAQPLPTEHLLVTGEPAAGGE
ncbi:MAG: alpha/beta fold hydrolase [Phycisphaeraceae bacterium]